ncbi:MAG TPA: glutathione S-transferase family protein [Candidatus Sulfotelmatobacter sp.]|nr:glutathione S-transferase family protein [Candidatus Sulfotelmatobacter sp.]
MAEFTLYIGNKNYSSWSLRAWLVLKQAGIVFDEVVIPLYRPESKPAILRHSPSGRVPCLRHGDTVVWDSLAIAEYVADLMPEAKLWPADPTARAVARGVSAEMHAGFMALRQSMPMNLRAAHPGKGMTPAVRDDVNRVTALWRDCRRRFAGAKPFLFGDPTIADAMYAPVVARFATYAVVLDDAARDYVSLILGLPALQAWTEAAQQEPWIIPEFER